MEIVKLKKTIDNCLAQMKEEQEFKNLKKMFKQFKVQVYNDVI